MSKTINPVLFVLTILVLSACTDDKRQQVSFEDLRLSETKTALTIAYYSAQGEPVPHGTTLLPNTEYTLEIQSESPVNFKFRSTDGFELIDAAPALPELSRTQKYRIKTTTTEQIDPFFSVHTIFEDDNGDLRKERAQLFLWSAYAN